jgi:hypothetical protein
MLRRLSKLYRFYIATASLGQHPFKVNAFLREIVGPAWACVRVIDQSEFLTTGSAENSLAIKRLNVVVGDGEVSSVAS